MWQPDKEKIKQEAVNSVERDVNFKNKHYAIYRTGEILPGALVWTVIIGLSLLAWFKPVWAAAFMVVYLLSWFVRAIRFSYFLLRSYPPFAKSQKTKWQQKIESDSTLAAKAKKVHHVILAATYKEEYETLARALDLLAQSTFPHDRIYFVLATEARDHDHAQAVAKQLKQKYSQYFVEFIVTEHPDDIGGEIRGKGTNISWAGRIVRDYLVGEKKLDPKQLLVTSIDADHRLHPEYLSALTYQFITDQNPEKSSYVSIALFFNNIWDVPSPVRFIHFSSTFWMMTTSVWTSRLHNVMTQTQTMSALMKTDFYSPVSIVEDGHQYWRSLFRFGDDYTVKMVLMPVYSDAVLTDSWFGTLKEQYLQRRRWHYGVSDVPFVLTHFLVDKKNRTFRVFVDLLRLWEGHFSLATSSYVLGVVGWIPILSANIATTVLGANFRALYSTTLRYALVGLLMTAILEVVMIPPVRHDKPFSRLYALWDYLLLPFQIPLSIVLAASVPSIDSHTRLMLGKYLGYFRVTIKAVSKKTDLSIS